MKLNVFKGEYGVDAVSMVNCGYMNILYDFDMSIKKFLPKIKKKLEYEILNDRDMINEDSDISIEEKNAYFELLNSISSKLDNEDEFLSCFDKIVIDIADINMLENIKDIIADINIPIVLNLRNTSDEYLLENLKVIDKTLKEDNSNKITYIINCCLSEEDTNGEDNSYSIDEVMLVLTTIKQITDVIKEFDLSPLEQVMYAYDIVKDHYYKDSDPGESYLDSRDVAKILKSGKIVCLGFSVLFKSILDKLGISNEIVYLDGANGSGVGHARNFVSINDHKYNLNHLFYFDATCDCKHNNVNINDVNRYDFFAKNRLFTLKADYNKLIDPIYMDYYLRKDDDYSFLFNGNISRKLREIKNIFRKIDWEQYFAKIDVSEDNLKKIQILMSDDLRTFVVLCADYDFCEFIYKECCKMLNRNLAGGVFLRCLYTVRRAQHYVDSDKYSDDPYELIDTYANYTGFAKTDEYKLVRILFGYDIRSYNKLQEFERQDTINSREKLLSCLGLLNNNINNLELDNVTSVKEAIKILKK